MTSRALPQWQSHFRLAARAALLALLYVAAGCEKAAENPPPSASAAPAVHHLTPTEINVEWSDVKVPSEMKAGDTVMAGATIKNTGSAAWPARREVGIIYAVKISYHWFRNDGLLVDYDGKRTNLQESVAPGQLLKVEGITITAPKTAGRYQLKLDLLQENVRWFNSNSHPIDVAVK